MITLYHHPFSASSRFIRLVLAEMGVSADLQLERPYERRRAFLLLNPAGTLPVMEENGGPPICGASPILEYLDETRGYGLGDRRLMPDNPEARAEMRRLVDWFLGKFDAEVSGYLVHEKIMKLEMPRSAGSTEPDSGLIRVARANVRHHMKYLGYLAGSRDWLAGPRLTYADLAAAAVLSTIDYLGEVPWDVDDHARHWYQRIKSRPAFRTLLTDRAAGMPPAPVYANLDF
jgi:glutathione S-transferase